EPPRDGWSALIRVRENYSFNSVVFRFRFLSTETGALRKKGFGPVSPEFLLDAPYGRSADLKAFACQRFHDSSLTRARMGPNPPFNPLPRGFSQANALPEVSR